MTQLDVALTQLDVVLAQLDLALAQPDVALLLLDIALAGYMVVVHVILMLPQVSCWGRGTDLDLGLRTEVSGHWTCINMCTATKVSVSLEESD